jgi:hypothetical protein
VQRVRPTADRPESGAARLGGTRLQAVTLQIRYAGACDGKETTLRFFGSAHEQYDSNRACEPLETAYAAAAECDRDERKRLIGPGLPIVFRPGKCAPQHEHLSRSSSRASALGTTDRAPYLRAVQRVYEPLVELTRVLLYRRCTKLLPSEQRHHSGIMMRTACGAQEQRNTAHPATRQQSRSQSISSSLTHSCRRRRRTKRSRSAA